MLNIILDEPPTAYPADSGTQPAELTGTKKNTDADFKRQYLDFVFEKIWKQNHVNVTGK